MAKANGKARNRRTAFRIYEQANLFYRKIDPEAPAESRDSFDDMLIRPAPPKPAAVEAVLPNSQSLENDTLNVNISASGIAFTSQEKLYAGDYLLLRILLLSSMTVVMTSCQVVYCKPSNPYENDRYPYLIGARFVNLADADAALLLGYIEKKQKQQSIGNGVLLALAVAVLAMPGQALGLLMGLLHHLIEVVLHVAHLGFEVLESNLDHIAEHTFHTDTHETQVIVFYTIMSFAALGLYLLWRWVPPVLRRWLNSLAGYWQRKKASTLYFWGERSLEEKIKLVGITLAVIVGYGYLGF